jgi:hypothetical protein
MSETLIDFLAIPLVHAGVCWLLAILIVLLIVLRLMGGGRLLAFNSPTGRVMVSKNAIKGLIARTCCGVEGISRPQSRIRTRGGKLRLRVYIHLRGNTRLADVSTLLQEKLDLALRQNLGIEKIGKIDIIVNDIQPCKGPSQPLAAARSTTYRPWGEESQE